MLYSFTEGQHDVLCWVGLLSIMFTLKKGLSRKCKTALQMVKMNRCAEETAGKYIIECYSGLLKGQAKGTKAVSP